MPGCAWMCLDGLDVPGCAWMCLDRRARRKMSSNFNFNFNPRRRGVPFGMAQNFRPGGGSLILGVVFRAWGSLEEEGGSLNRRFDEKTSAIFFFEKCENSGIFQLQI